MSDHDLEAELARLRAENDALHQRNRELRGALTQAACQDIWANLRAVLINTTP